MGGGWGRGGRLFEAGRLLTFSSFRMGAYSRWALIRGWARIQINTVCLRVLKEGNQRRFDSYSVRNSILITSHSDFRDCRVHTFSDSLSRNSSIRQEDHALCHGLAFHWKQDLHSGGSLGWADCAMQWFNILRSIDNNYTIFRLECIATPNGMR